VAQLSLDRPETTYDRLCRQSFDDMVRARPEAPRPASSAGAIGHLLLRSLRNYNDPELALAVEQVLAAHGVNVIFPKQRASGIPEMLYGMLARP
jgi:Fe-S oxidoreductase